MTKKEIITPVIVIGLTLLFAGICIAVFLTRGKSKKWIARKIKIGGILLSLTAISSGTGGCITCYDQPYEPQPQFMFNSYNSDNYQIEIDLDTNNILKGNLSESIYENYSFAIGKTSDEKLQQGEITPIDGKFDTENEEIQLEIDPNITSGNYSLYIFANGISEQINTNPMNTYNLLIVNEQK